MAFKGFADIRRIPKSSSSSSQILPILTKRGTGDITVAELAAVFRSLGQNPSDTELQDIISEVDTDRDGTISFAEFISMMTRKTSTSDIEAEIKAAFNVFDSDHCGFIRAAELKSVMSTIGENLTDGEIEEMINLVDTNGDGKISCE